MKFSDETLDILKNFSSINQGIRFERGKELMTVSPNETLIAKANIPDEIDGNACVYDLNKFLSTASLFKEGEIEFQDDRSRFWFRQDSKQAYFTYSSPEMIILPKSRNIIEIDYDYTFDVEWGDFKELLKASSIMQLKEVCFNSDGVNIYMSVINSENPTANRYDNYVTENESGESFEIIVNTDNLKILPRDYKISVSLKNKLIYLVADDIQYWIGAKAK